jgi:hypothetical protein
VKALWRAIASLALAGFVAGQAGAWIDIAHASPTDDAACVLAEGDAVVGPHHQSGPQIEQVLPSAPIEHCALCHMVRTLSSSRPAATAVLVSPEAAVVAAADTIFTPLHTARPTFAPRGPPRA